MDGLVIREVTRTDLESLCRLSAELGYPASAEVMEQRVQALTQLADHSVYVASLRSEVVGWIHVAIVHHLQAEARAEIGGLVVGTEVRGNGIGRELLIRAEQWALQRGVRSVVVRSQIARDAAHRFYLREGYKQTKTSAVFTKTLS
jgi:GNAT superfamily N-acetyltransferase